MSIYGAEKSTGEKGTLPGMSPTRMDLIPFLHFVAQLRGRRGQVVGSRSKVPDSGSGIRAILPLVHGVVALNIHARIVRIDIVGALEAAALAWLRLESMRGTAVTGFGAAQSGVWWRQQAIVGVVEGLQWQWQWQCGS